MSSNHANRNGSGGGALVIEDIPEHEHVNDMNRSACSDDSSSARPLKRGPTASGASFSPPRSDVSSTGIKRKLSGEEDDDPLSHRNTKAASAAAGEEPSSAPKEADERTSQDYYFDSYSHHAIHEEMLKDHVRTQTYQMAITQNAHLFRDKVVLDVGCGTGILSLFCAQVGAKHVYAVDCSSILQQAKKIVDRNGFSDKITLIQGKIEEINLPVDTVDIIVSEWMGYFLLYESMLDTVIFARDKWLVKENGIIFPDKAVMYLSAMEDENVRRERIDFWDDVYGFDMSPIKEIALREPVVDVVDPKALVTDAVPILHLDILTCTKEDLAFTADFKLQARRNDFIHGLVAYFECAFTQIHKPIGFSTAPFCRYTHWKQTMFYVPETVTICAGETFHGHLECKPNPRNKRDLDIAISYQFKGKHSNVDTTVKYRLR
eukprot:CAMPEP_0172449086 /NCGR_PEP_ID=MMETSP1065-20121228/7885_1 /TAXON_ID=265537 /ORGANISM="Amphiprora paludosa, Strain CCMP125" /LENGTH=432 /DNA_ID=CAMNT_0013200685 /DNA_START=70 /DNA_END=1368 /DNA_ORIENTATION=-